MKPFSAVILAGGRARRMGGADKTSLMVGDATLLDRSLAAISGARDIVVCGPERSTSVPVRWTREEPPGGGPAAALAAAVELVTQPLVAVLAVDVPFVTAELVLRLVASASATRAAMAIGDGEAQPLVAVYPSEPLLARCRFLAPLSGVSMWTLVGEIPRVEIENESAGFDIDTWERLAEAERVAQGGRWVG